MSNFGKRAFRIVLGLGVCMPALVTPALAQDTAESEAQEIIVTGSRIPTIKDQGPSPVTTIDSDTIRANGYTSVPELLAAMTQNSGETQSPQWAAAPISPPARNRSTFAALAPTTRWC